MCVCVLRACVRARARARACVCGVCVCVYERSITKVIKSFLEHSERLTNTFNAGVNPFFSVHCRCKLFAQQDGKYQERGIGNLFLKPCDTKTQLIIRADTPLGKF